MKFQKIFNYFSVVFIIFIGIYFSTRIIYFKLKSNDKIITISLAETVINSNDKYHINTNLNKINNEYRFTGKADNNYVKYQGYLWRILRVNNDKSITIITEDTITYLSTNNIINYLNSTDSNYSGIFNKTLDETYLINNKLCTDSFIDIESASCFNVDKHYKIGILSVKEYIYAGGNNSFLNNGTHFWTSNKYNDTQYWYINNDGKISNDIYTNKHGIRPVITLKNNIDIISGNGTYNKPYIIQQRTVNSLNDTYIGEYIQYNNEIWRIVDKLDNQIKLAQIDTLKINNNELTIQFSKQNNIVSNQNELITYLNSTYLSQLPNQNYLTKGKFYTGYYSLANNNYQNVYKSSITNYIGLLSITDLYAYEVTDTYLINPSTSNDLSIYMVSDNNTLYENFVNVPQKIRISLFMKNNIEITSGNGTVDSPYILGGIINEN